MDRTLSRDDIERYLRLLGERLAAIGKRAEVLLAGGAVMVLLLEAREATKDIAAYFSGDVAELRAAVRSIAEEYGLREDWLNDGIQGFFYTQPPQLLWAEYPGLTVFTVGPDYLLAMKVIAGRPDLDASDARDLARNLVMTHAEQVMECVERYVPPRLIPAYARHFVEALFPEES